MAAPSEEYKTGDMDRDQLLEVVREKEEQITNLKQLTGVQLCANNLPSLEQLRKLGFKV